ncbi:MAG: cadherin-like domain-containing protein, partial [Deltaproteobacteria bacterium]|nr:cadherin-like domain-containing protein [Deltaproteobacteria bacterium]
YGNDTFTYTISDDNGGRDTASVSITVTNVPDAPVANDDTHTVTKDSGANTIDVLANDTDADSDTFLIVAVGQGAHGRVAIIGGGTGLTYTPDDNYTGNDTFTYTVSDGNGGTNTATVNVSINDLRVDGLVGYWKFNEASGSITADTSGSDNTGTLINEPTWVSGKNDNALSFNGVNSYVDCGNDPSLNLMNSLTISAWINPTSFGQSGYGRIVDKGNGSTGFSLFVNESGSNMGYLIYGESLVWSDADIITTDQDQWQFVAVVYNESSQTVTFYINDQMAGSSNYQTNPIDSSSDPLVIGIRGYDLNRAFDGIIDDVRVHNRALAASEVAALYDDGNGTTSPDVDRVTTPFESIIELWFNDPEPFGGLLTEEPGDYTINNGINVHKVSLDVNNNRVRLFTDVHNTGTDYTLSIAGFDTSVNYTYVNGLIGNWKLDEYSGTEAQDSSGNGNTATLQNGPGWTTQGGISLDGGNDAVEIPTIGWDAGSGTLSLWAYAQDLSDMQFFFGHVADSLNRIQLYSVAGSLALGLGGNPILRTGIEMLDTNVWYNLALTWDGTNYSVYVDGIEKAVGAYSGLTTLNSYADIGNYGLASSRDAAFDGLIGDVRMYNRAYSDAEVQDLYLTYQVNENRQLALATTEQLDDGSTITYQLQNPEDLPVGATFKDSDGTVTWRPWYDQAGAFELTFAENGQPENTKTYTVVANNITLKDWYRTWLQDINKL